MGWLRTLFLGDIGNRLDIADTERDISQVRLSLHSVREAQSRTDEDQDQRLVRLEIEIEQLELTIAAIVHRLSAKGVLQSADLADIVDRLDPDTDGR